MKLFQEFWHWLMSKVFSRLREPIAMLARGGEKAREAELAGQRVHVPNMAQLTAEADEDRARMESALAPQHSLLLADIAAIRVVFRKLFPPVPDTLGTAGINETIGEVRAERGVTEAATEEPVESEEVSEEEMKAVREYLESAASTPDERARAIAAGFRFKATPQERARAKASGWKFVRGEPQSGGGVRV